MLELAECQAGVIVKGDRRVAAGVALEVGREEAGEPSKVLDEAAVVVEQAEDSLNLLHRGGFRAIADVLDVVLQRRDAIGGHNVA